MPSEIVTFHRKCFFRGFIILGLAMLMQLSFSLNHFHLIIDFSSKHFIITITPRDQVDRDMNSTYVADSAILDCNLLCQTIGMLIK